MIRTPVESSNVISIGHQDGILEVEFKSGIYHYDAPAEVFDALMAANSKGQYINAHIKGTYEYRKVA
jgi:hypothetical protein